MGLFHIVNPFLAAMLPQQFAYEISANCLFPQLDLIHATKINKQMFIRECDQTLAMNWQAVPAVEV